MPNTNADNKGRDHHRASQQAARDYLKTRRYFFVSAPLISHFDSGHVFYSVSKPGNTYLRKEHAQELSA